MSAVAMRARLSDMAGMTPPTLAACEKCARITAQRLVWTAHMHRAQRSVERTTQEIHSTRSCRAEFP